MLVDKLKRMLAPTRPSETAAGEKPASFYDDRFDQVESFHQHYTESPYYMIWTVIIDRVRRQGARSVLEIACGTGQLAHAITDAIPDIGYLGFDFSTRGIEIARQRAPSLDFRIDDALKTGLLSTADYDTVISTEFLEHVEQDIDVVGRIRAGARFIGTVPNFPYVSHVRHFEDAGQVAERYRAHFDDFTVVSLRANPQDKTFFLMEGTRASGA